MFNKINGVKLEDIILNSDFFKKKIIPSSGIIEINNTNIDENDFLLKYQSFFDKLTINKIKKI